jgi:elongation factor 3
LGELSGGQKVKVVIGGLANAIKNWDGAVVMISHSQEFVSALCPETWTLEAGKLDRSGKSAVEDEKQVDDEKVKAKLSKKKKKTRNDIKKQEDRRRARHLKWLIEGGEKEADTDSD